MSRCIVEFNGGLKNLYSVINCVEEEEDDRIGLGDRVTVRGGIKGIVRYIGKVHYNKDIGKIYVGIECDGPCGRNNGTVKGKTYFTCANNHGILTRVTNVKKEKKASSTNKFGSTSERSKTAKTQNKLLDNRDNDNVLYTGLTHIIPKGRSKCTESDSCVKEFPDAANCRTIPNQKLMINPSRNNDLKISEAYRQQVLPNNKNRECLNHSRNMKKRSEQINDKPNSASLAPRHLINDSRLFETKEEKNGEVSYQTKQSTQPNLKVGDKVRLRGYRSKGIVKYVGHVHYKQNQKLFVGVELSSCRGGKNDGKVRGKRYFHCTNGERRGLILDIDAVELL